MFSAALLSIIQEAGNAIMIMTEGNEQQEILRSRLTRAEIIRQLLVIVKSLEEIPSATRERIPELAWKEWARLPDLMAASGETADQALIYAYDSLVPATLLWLREYQLSQPALFEFVP